MADIFPRFVVKKLSSQSSYWGPTDGIGVRHLTIYTPISTKTTASNRHGIRWLFYAVVLTGFGYGTYKLHVVPRDATRFDFWLVMGSIIAAGVFTLIDQLRARKQRRMGRS